MPTNVVNSVVVQTATIVSPVINATVSSNINVNAITMAKKKKKKKALKEKKPRPKPGEIRLTTALGNWEY